MVRTSRERASTWTDPTSDDLRHLTNRAPGCALVYYPWASSSGREAAGSAPKLALFVAEFAFSFFFYILCDHTHTVISVCVRVPRPSCSRGGSQRHRFVVSIYAQKAPHALCAMGWPERGYATCGTCAARATRLKSVKSAALDLYHPTKTKTGLKP